MQTGGTSLFGNPFYRNDGNGQITEVSDAIGAETYWPWGLSAVNYPFRYAANCLLLNNAGRGFLDSEYVIGVEPRKGGVTAAPVFELLCSSRDKGHGLCESTRGRLHSFGEIGKSNWLVEFHQYWLEAHANGFGGRVGFGMNYYQPFDGGYYEVDVNTITRNENEPYLNLFVSKVLFADITFRLDSDNKDYCLEVKALRAGRFALKAGDTPMTYAFHLDATAYEPWTISVAVSAGVSMVRRWTVRLG